MKIGIVGYGHVGSAMKKLFTDAFVYDPFLKLGEKSTINDCDAAFVCVPTPARKDGTCNTDIVEEVISWCEAKLIIIRSTVYVGFTEYASKKYKKQIVFQPEYYGETINHPFADLSTRNWLTFGGTKSAVNSAIEVYQTVVNSNIRIIIGPSSEIEMAKYMENAFLATKVVFCNEIYNICKKMEIDYNIVREAWIADPRIGSSHTFVYKDNPGYGGSCLPKDISSLIKQATKICCDTTLLNAVVKKNDILKKI